jgi:MFS family permease
MNEKNIQYHTTRYSWYVVVLLTLAYVLSYVDRQILSLLVEPIKADFDLSDTQMGLLLGAAFAIFYATMGIPLGWLADNMSRRTIVGVGIAVWSAATIASGFALNFSQLFVSRVAVGAGEASLSPCAISMISDMFPEGKRARAIAVYSGAISLAAGLSYIGGGALLEWAYTLDLSQISGLENIKYWQVVFLIVGLPGLLLSLLMFFVSEPAREQTKNIQKSQNDRKKFGDAFTYLKSNGAALLGLSLAVGAMTVIVYSQFFNAALFARTWGWSGSEFGIRNGIGLLLVGPPSIFLGGWLIDYFHKQGVKDGSIKVISIGLFITVIFNSLFPLMPTGWSALIMSLIGLVGIALVTAGGPPAILAIIPSDIRGQVIAIYYMVISLCGLLLGPTAVGFFTDTVFNDPAKLRYSLALIAAIVGIPALLAMPTIKRLYLSQLDKVAAEIEQESGNNSLKPCGEQVNLAAS